MAKAKQPVTLMSNGKRVTFDALLKQTDGYSSAVPSYPVETGFEVSDSIIIESPTLAMTLYLANTPVTWKGRNGANQVEHHCAMLESLYFQKAVCQISTTEKSYGDMAIESMNIIKSEETGYDKQVEISFRQIIVTSTKTVSIPSSYGKSGATGASNGAASTSQGSTGSSGSSGGAASGGASNGSKSSILYAAGERMGLFG